MYKGGTVGSIIVAAGESRRMNGVNKMQADLAGKPVLAYSLDIFLHTVIIDRLVLVLNRNDMETGRQLLENRDAAHIAQVCAGAARRQDSVAAGLSCLGKCDWVIIHDGARPMITAEFIERGLEAAQSTGAAAAAVPVKDTIKIVEKDGIVAKTLPREQLWTIQTPQVFRFDIITAGHLQVKNDVTDDAAMVEQIGCQVKVFNGSYDNIKITLPRDLIIAEQFIKEHGQ